MTESDFDFSGFVRDLVVEAVKHSPQVQDTLYREAVSTIESAIKDVTSDHQLVAREEFEEVKDAVLEAEQDLDDMDEDLSDLEDRVEALETESILEEDFEALEQDFIRLQKIVNQYLPLLDALNKAAPLLRMLGLIKDVEVSTHRHHHPIINDHLHEDQRPSARQPFNWMS